MQPTLFDRSPHLSTPYQASSETSKAAADRAKDFVGEQGAVVLSFILTRGLKGATQKEAHAALGIGRPSLCARFRALEQTKQIEKTAERRGGCVVYVAR